MNQDLKKTSILALRWTLGIVVLYESVRFVLSSAAAHFLANARMPVWIRPALGGAEIVATFLFLIPYTYAIGSFALLVIFAIAAIVHILHGQYEVGGLLVYGVGVFVCMTHAKASTSEASHDGR